MAAPDWLWLPQAQKCNSYMMTYIMRLLFFGGSDFLGSLAPLAASGPLAAPGPKMQFLHNDLHHEIAAFWRV